MAALATAGDIPWKRRIAIVLIAPVAGLAALALLDLATGGDAHFTRSVLEAGGLNDIADVVQRRVRLSYRSLGRGAIPFLVVFALIGLAVGFRKRKSILAAANGAPGVQAAVYGLLAAVLIGALTNDSGPVILLIGSSYLLFTAVYLASGPVRAARTPATGSLASKPPTAIDSIARMRIALVSPYSWTFPGGVNRHIDALARELLAEGHDVRVLAPVDPDDRLTRALHRRAPEPTRCPDYVRPLGRTLALPMNGAMSHVAGHSRERRAPAPRAARRRRSTCARARADRPDGRLGRMLRSTRAAGGRHLPRLLDQLAPEHDRARHRRAPPLQPAARAHRRLRGRALDRRALLRRRRTR